MSEIKWIKIVTDIFDNEKMYAIECMPDGVQIQVVWLKILCLAGKCNQNGFLTINNKIAYTNEMLAHIFRMDIGVIQRALEVFQRLEMIEVVDDAYMVANWNLYQSQTGLEKIKEQNRIRQRRFRESQKIAQLGENPICVYCGGTATGFDHIVPKSRGGKEEEDNLVLCCKHCNEIKNCYSLAEFLNNNDFIRRDLVDAEPKLSKFVKWDEKTSRYVTLQNNVTPSISYSYSNNTNLSNYLYLLNTSNEEYINYYKDIKEIDEIVQEWMRYKDEKKPKSSNHYEETGLKSLLKKIFKMCAEYGAYKVAAAISDSMSNNYQGIVWDYLTKAPKNQAQERDYLKEIRDA